MKTYSSIRLDKAKQPTTNSKLFLRSFGPFTMVNTTPSVIETYNLSNDDITIDNLTIFIKSSAFNDTPVDILRSIMVNFMNSPLIKNTDRMAITTDEVLVRFFNMMRPQFQTIIETLITIPVGYTSCFNIKEDLATIRRIMEIFGVWTNTNVNYLDLAISRKSYVLLISEFIRLNTTPEVITSYINRLVSDRNWLIFSYFFVDTTTQFRQYITMDQVRMFVDDILENTNKYFTIPNNINMYNFAILNALVMIATDYYPKFFNENRGSRVRDLMRVFPLWRETTVNSQITFNPSVISLMARLINSTNIIELII